ncbi:hypothetical protein EYC84_002064 [Monilinia fructicola]|uniref:Uncharacterized protein n=1 Tax=Monilinia fructicola TaxID=38448 RepID=A0A5M9JU50_MONFR|nr:hypothetical protein EYC84_002064 [Monilinia fructicola]
MIWDDSLRYFYVGTSLTNHLGRAGPVRGYQGSIMGRSQNKKISLPVNGPVGGWVFELDPQIDESGCGYPFRMGHPGHFSSDG